MPQWRGIGDPTEAGLLTFAAKAGVVADGVRAHAPRTGEIPFDAASKMMMTTHETASGVIAVLKGAPELVIGLCSHVQQGGRAVPMNDVTRDELRSTSESMGESALRVLALAVVREEGMEGVELADGFEALRGRATLLGLVG